MLKNQVTWPPYTTKCYLDPYNEGNWAWVVDDNGSCYDPTPWAEMQLDRQAMFNPGRTEWAALDYYEDRSNIDMFANHGWPDIIWEVGSPTPSAYILIDDSENTPFWVPSAYLGEPPILTLNLN